MHTPRTEAQVRDSVCVTEYLSMDSLHAVIKCYVLMKTINVFVEITYTFYVSSDSKHDVFNNLQILW